MYGNEGGGFGGQRRSFAPVKVGDELDVKIEAVGEKGDGIAKKDGFVLFVPGVNEGDEVRIRVTKVLRKVGFAEVIGEGASKESEEEPEEETETPEEEPEEEKESDDEPEEKKPKKKKGAASESVEDTEDFGEDIEEEK